jgi:hypothetical protein
LSGRILASFLAVLLLMVAGSAEPSRVVQAEEILKKIELGMPVEYDNVTVVGDLNLSGLNLPRATSRRTLIMVLFYKPMVEFPGLMEFSPGLIASPGLLDHEIIVASPISIVNSVIEGSMNFDGIVFQNTSVFTGTRFEGPAFLRASRFNKSAHFWSVQFNDTVDFSHAQFNQTADFRLSQFNRTSNFGRAQFDRATRFTSSQFNDTADFQYVQFNQTTNFERAQFKQTAKFWYAKFNDTANFNYAQFKQDAELSRAQFKQYANFESTQFNGATYFTSALFDQFASFEHAQFNQTANFGSTQFNDTAYFNYAQFNQAAEFLGAQFNQTVEFLGAQFNQTAIFWDAKFNQESDFSDARLLDVFFDNSQFSKEAFFDGARINGTLSLYRTKYDTLNIRWSSIHDLAYDDTAYHLLIQNFNKLGFVDDARECQYSYRCKHREELFRQHKFDRWLFDLLAYATYGYGLRPVRPLGWSLSFILIGGLFLFLTKSVTRSKAGPSEKKPHALRRREEKPDGEVSIWEALLLSATYFTSGASSIISSTPTEFVPVGRARYVVVLLRLLGWIFFVIFLSSLNRTV